MLCSWLGVSSKDCTRSVPREQIAVLTLNPAEGKSKQSTQLQITCDEASPKTFWLTRTSNFVPPCPVSGVSSALGWVPKNHSYFTQLQPLKSLQHNWGWPQADLSRTAVFQPPTFFFCTEWLQHMQDSTQEAGGCQKQWNERRGTKSYSCEPGNLCSEIPQREAQRTRFCWFSVQFLLPWRTLLWLLPLILILAPRNSVPLKQHFWWHYCSSIGKVRE